MLCKIVSKNVVKIQKFNKCVKVFRFLDICIWSGSCKFSLLWQVYSSLAVNVLKRLFSLGINLLCFLNFVFDEKMLISASFTCVLLLRLSFHTMIQIFSVNFNFQKLCFFLPFKIEFISSLHCFPLADLIDLCNLIPNQNRQYPILREKLY